MKTKKYFRNEMSTWTNSYSLVQTGAFLKQVRKDKGYTQEEFSEIIGVSHATLISLEKGRAVSSATLESALNFLGLRLVIVPKSAEVAVSINTASLQHSHEGENND